VEHDETGVLQDGRVLVGRARRRRDELDALVHDHVDDGRVTDERQWQVHAERLVRELARAPDVGPHLVDAE